MAIKTIKVSFPEGGTLFLHHIKEVFGFGHDDSIPFNAELSWDGDKIAGLVGGYAQNDGWGGPSVVNGFSNREGNALRRLDDYLRKNHRIKYHGEDIGPASLEFVVSEMVYFALDCNIKETTLEKILSD